MEKATTMFVQQIAEQISPYGAYRGGRERGQLFIERASRPYVRKWFRVGVSEDEIWEYVLITLDSERRAA